jgi:opacity protein-like surface antigen
MKKSLFAGAAGLAAIGAVHAQGLYYTGSESQESVPLKWSVGITATYDDNVNPTAPVGLPGYDEDAFSVNPYVGVSFLTVSPQTTWDVYARLGLIYYIDSPSAAGSEDLYTQFRLGANITHRVNERLRISSRTFIAYELEPDYAYGYASTRQLGEYLYWETDNAVGYRWTERFGTYSGLVLSGLDYDSSVPNSDRFTWTLYNQFRYQTSPRAVVTAEYRYSQTEANGLASDTTDQYLLAGLEYRLSPNTIFSGKVGAQFHDVDSATGENSTSPYVEAGLNTQVNTNLSVRAFARYATENYDTVRAVGPALFEFNSRETFRLGVSATYTISPKLSLFGGVDYIPATFDDGVQVAPVLVPAPRVSGLSEDLVNAYIGLTVRFNDLLSGDVSYNYTDSSSDFLNNDYNRSRISVGVRAEF